jgi:hypothetical protein
MATRLLELPGDGSFVQAVDANKEVFMIENQNSFDVRFVYAGSQPASDSFSHTLASGEIKSFRAGAGSIYCAQPVVIYGFHRTPVTLVVTD